ncbi:MAG: AtpZ/AtpI family protein [Proteobacteria bacterium]|jgi:F0F1-type ATP synthase assembly protein I|nr:AtpZ/AtpI family protein [Pseudomonadota bacterium]
MKPDTKKDLSNVIKSVSHIGSFGLTMGACILMGYYLGSYIDSKLGTAPWFMMVLVLLFMLGAFIKFVQETRSVSDKQAGKKGDVSHN